MSFRPSLYPVAYVTCMCTIFSSAGSFMVNYTCTVKPRYLELAYFELPLISKWKSGPCFNMKLWQQVTKYCGKEEKLLLREQFLLFSTIFSVYLYFQESNYILFVKCGCLIYLFSSIPQIWYVEIRISRSISESPLDFEITRVDCISLRFKLRQRLVGLRVKLQDFESRECGRRIPAPTRGYSVHRIITKVF